MSDFDKLCEALMKPESEVQLPEPDAQAEIDGETWGIWLQLDPSSGDIYYCPKVRDKWIWRRHFRVGAAYKDLFVQAAMKKI